MDSPKQLSLQQLDREGLNLLVNWADQEGWNPGPMDADVFWETDPNGFWGYYSDDDLIGGGSIISYGGEFGFMGFFILRPQYRGNGIGRQLWHQRRHKLLSRLKPNAPIGMDGVIAMQKFYEKGGFKIAFRDERYERTGTEMPVHTNISSITESDLPSVLAYDKFCFGFSRQRFLKLWLQYRGSKSFKYTERDGLKGFVVVRPAGKGYKIGPLFADNESIAEDLYKACLNAFPGELLYLDIPVANPGAVKLVKRYKATCVFECARMYLGPPPPIDINKVFGITTLELG